ncbi:MAG: division/cell wall cluster transcriptional repressor MraZ [Sumerlaeia bacterium]
MEYEYTGNQEVRTDDRLRMPIPSKMLAGFRKFALPESEWENKDAEVKVVVGLSIELKPTIFPKPVFDEMIEFLKSKPKHNPEWQRLRKTLIGMAEEQVLDNQGRIRIPRFLAKRFKLSGNIIIMNAGDQLELHNADDFESSLDDLELLVGRLTDQMNDD